MNLSVAIIILLLHLTRAGAAGRPVVTFSPEWYKVSVGESVIMTCYTGSTEEEDPIYNWYKDNHWIHTGKIYTIPSAQESHGGSYQCQTNSSDKSNSVRLEVYKYYVILQTPLHVFEGDNVTLRCHHYYGYTARQTIFYKDQIIVQNWGSESELLVENVDMTPNWRYKCTKEVYHDLLYYRHSDKVTISVQELFTPPVLRVEETDPMILVCETRLSPLRQTMELEFVFYRDGQEVEKSSSSDWWIIPPAWQNNSGTYTCEVRTTRNTVRKTSNILTTEAKIQWTHNPSLVLYVVCVALVILLLLLVGATIFRERQIWSFINNQNQMPDLPESQNYCDTEPRIAKDNDYCVV